MELYIECEDGYLYQIEGEVEREADGFWAAFDGDDAEYFYEYVDEGDDDELDEA